MSTVETITVTAPRDSTVPTCSAGGIIPCGITAITLLLIAILAIGGWAVVLSRSLGGRKKG